MVLAVNSSLNLHVLGQCTYLGYLLLEAPREYVQHGPLLSINWLWLCPQSGACVRSHAVRRRLFIVLMTAAHISPNVFSLRDFLSNIHVLHLPYIHHHSCLLYITFVQAITSFYYMITCSLTSLALRSRPAAYGLLCLIQVVPCTNAEYFLSSFRVFPRPPT